MDRESIERVRTATFATARRGYDKREVDRFLSRMADWLESGAGDDSRSQVIRDELTRIGEQTGKIMTDAHEVAEGMRADAERDATNVRSEADAYAERVRIEADEYSKEQRGEADSYIGRVQREAATEASELREQAERQAEEVSAEAARRRRQLEVEIGELKQRREGVLADMQRLSSQLVGTASEHRPVPVELVDEFDDEALEVGEAEFEEFEDEVEDGAIAEAGEDDEDLGSQAR